MSTSCTTQQPLLDNQRDRLVRLVKGKYAGHPNRNRGRSEPQQCQWRGPKDARTSYFEPPLVTFESSTDGLLEYTSNLLGGQLKGNLLASKHDTSSSPGRIYRIRLNSEGGVDDGGVDSLWESSGLSIAMSPWGDILSAHVYSPDILVLRPQYKVLSVPMFSSVLPFRGPLSGGNSVQVSGHNFGPSPVAMFGTKPCSTVTDVAPDGTSFRCIVPAGDGKGTGVQVSVKVAGQATADSSGGVDYMYMAV
jgi:hypothetical protein